MLVCWNVKWYIFALARSLNRSLWLLYLGTWCGTTTVNKTESNVRLAKEVLCLDFFSCVEPPLYHFHYSYSPIAPEHHSYTQIVPIVETENKNIQPKIAIPRKGKNNFDARIALPFQSDFILTTKSKTSSTVSAEIQWFHWNFNIVNI